MALGGRSSRLIDPRFHDELRVTAVADAGLPDHAVITRSVPGTGTVDNDGTWTPTGRTQVYSGHVRVQPANFRSSRQVVVGEEVVTLHRYVAVLESDAVQVLIDDILTVDESADTQMIGRPLIVRDVMFDTFGIRRVLDLEDEAGAP